MMNENNQENTKVSEDEEPVVSNQDPSADNHITIDDATETNTTNTAADQADTPNEYDSNVYYSNNAGWKNGEDSKEPIRSTETGNRQERKMPLFGQAMSQMRLPKITSKEEARKVFYGQSAVYYEKYYQKLMEQKKKISWNWAAFFFNIYWFFSRKMYVYGTLVVACKSILSIVGINLIDNMANPNVQTMLIPWVLTYLAVNVAVGMFANYLYISHMDSKIVYPGETELSNDDLAKVIIMRGGISLSGVLMCILLSDVLIYGLQYLMSLL